MILQRTLVWNGKIKSVYNNNEGISVILWYPLNQREPNADEYTWL